MTAQIGERLHYQAQEVAMCEQPLATYFARIDSYPEFEANCTALWRGYVGTWEILDGRLYLIGSKGKALSPVQECEAHLLRHLFVHDVSRKSYKNTSGNRLARFINASA